MILFLLAPIVDDKTDEESAEEYLTGKVRTFPRSLYRRVGMENGNFLLKLICYDGIFYAHENHIFPSPAHLVWEEYRVATDAEVKHYLEHGWA